jgi:hypothetical protein
MATPNANIQFDVSLDNGTGGKVTITTTPPPPMSSDLEFDSSAKHIVYLPPNNIYYIHFNIIYPGTSGTVTIIITDVSQTPPKVLFNKTYSAGTDGIDQFIQISI